MLNAWIRLSHSQQLRALIRSLGLHGFAQRAYAAFAPPVIQTRIAGAPVSLRAGTPEQLRLTEGLLLEERALLEKLIDCLGPDDVFWDIGAHYGVYTVASARRVRNVVAFEPMPATLQILTDNLALTRLTNVQVCAFALSKYDSYAKMNDQGDSCEHISENGRISIRTRGGDSIVTSGEVAAPTVIKMDIEGHEYTALSAMTTILSDPRCRVLACEVHPRLLPSDISDRHIFTLVRDCGFTTLDQHVKGTEIHLFASKH